MTAYTIEHNSPGIIGRNLTGFGLPVLRRMIRNWQARRQLRSLQTFDDSILADIGITRDDLHYGQQLSSRADVMAEMNLIREQRIGRIAMLFSNSMPPSADAPLQDKVHRGELT